MPEAAEYDLMTAELTRRLTVAACIGCGALCRIGECADGCSDVPLDIVDARAADALAEHVEGLGSRIRALRSLTSSGDAPLDELRDRARAALRLAVPPRDRDVRIHEPWGCPRCGRIDAPQPCIGVCLRRPVLTADAGEYRRLARTADQLADEERRLVHIARTVANVWPRPGYESTTTAAVRELLARAR